MRKLFLFLILITCIHNNFAQQKKTILVTGGAGYIGSHTALLLAQENYQVIILDLLLHNQKFDHPWATLTYGDCGDKDILNHLFATYNIHAVMHFAGNIEVGESVKNPLKFYYNNVSNTINLLDVMRAHACHLFIFSSSCAVYGTPQWLPLTEDHPTNPISPYGHTKLMVEHILHDCESAYGIRSVALRYFNAAGALPEYGLHEQHEPETHVIPLLLQAAHVDKPFYIFGTDHATPDGTCIRDFLHVWDIAHAHLKALHYLEAGNTSDTFNLGTGIGTSVQEMISKVNNICKKDIHIIYADKRTGDPAILVANANKAERILGWQPHRSDISSILQNAYEGFLSINKG